MHRRDALRLAGQAFALTALAPLAGCGRPGRGTADSAYLFFAPSQVPDIRVRARSALLNPVFEQWRGEAPAALRAAVDKAAESGNLLYDFRDALQALTRASVVHLVTPSADRHDAIRYTIERLVALPKWDYMLDGPDDVIGIQRASMANVRLLFAREVLGSDLGEDLEGALFTAVAEKGCLPCFRTVDGMDHPETVQGWRFDEDHRSVFEIDLSRWPEILGANNLRAIPTMGLGLGALALRGRDDRAEAWLDTAVQSSRHFLGFFSDDGSYFEGISYVDYALRTLLGFLDAHQRLVGTVDWTAEVNPGGVLAFILTMQAGRNDDGTPDVVNFSDSRKSVYPCIPAWFARQTGSAVARFAAEHASEPGYFLDFLWYEPGRPSAAPPDALKNRRLDLGWVVCRTGWEADDAVLAFRSGGPANHEHADRNSFLFKIHGERLLTDPFGAAYDWREPGWLLRLTEAHNAVLIDGRGHQYHNGEEGTNESRAAAHLRHYEDEGDRVWWVSDATPAYRLVDDDVVRVQRTVLFARPDVVVLLDQVEKRSTPSRVAVRFFPDNRDGAAQLSIDGAGFRVDRPRARLFGAVYAAAAPALQAGRLELPEELGVYPYLEAQSTRALRHEVLTVLQARTGAAAPPPVPEVRATGSGWDVTLGSVKIALDTGGDLPRVRDAS